MDQALQIAGAAMILAGFVLAQAGLLSPTSRWYLVLNLAGSAILAVIAFLDRQWGFFLLEGVWAAVSAVSLASVYRSSRNAPGRSFTTVRSPAYDEQSDPLR